MKNQALPLLGSLLCEPEDLLWEVDVFGKLSELFPEDHQALSVLAELKTLTTDLSESDKQEILIDYTRLFVGAGKPEASPYMSSWATEEAPWKSEDYLRFLDEASIQTSDTLQDLPEHLTVMLECLCLLRSSNDLRDQDAGKVFFHRFIQPFAQRWIVAFETKAYSSYYKKVAKLFHIWLEREKAINS